MSRSIVRVDSRRIELESRAPMAVRSLFSDAGARLSSGAMRTITDFHRTTFLRAVGFAVRDPQRLRADSGRTTCAHAAPTARTPSSPDAPPSTQNPPAAAPAGTPGVASDPIPAARAGTTQIVWFGHAAFKITTPSGKVLLIDPWITNPTNPSGASDLAGLSRVDYILVSHGHTDHVGNAVDIARRTGARLIATFDLGEALARYEGYPRAQVTPETLGNFGGHVSLFDGEVTVMFVPAVHSSTISPRDAHGASAGDPRPAGNPGGFLLKGSKWPIHLSYGRHGRFRGYGPRAARRPGDRHARLHRRSLYDGPRESVRGCSTRCAAYAGTHALRNVPASDWHSGRDARRTPTPEHSRRFARASRSRSDGTVESLSPFEETPLSPA